MKREIGEKTPRRRFGCLRFLGCLFLLLILAGLVAGGGLFYVYWQYGRNLPDISTIDHYRAPETTRILSTDGVVIATLFKENRVWSELPDISPYAVKALLAIEDSRFYQHPGFDPVGALRAAYVAASTGRVREGASTITMQLARNLFLTNEPTLERKLREIFIALEIERRYSKDKILELYLNQVYYGSGAYGIHSAARLYFGKSASELSAAEAALVVGLLQAPSRFSPLVDKTSARTRQGQVLARMHELGYLNAKALAEAKEEADAMQFKGVAKRSFEVLKYPYFTSYVIKELSDRYPEEMLYQGGLTVATTLDTRLQKQAEKVVRERVAELASVLNVDNGALVLVENDTGFIRAMVGGTHWNDENQFNRAWQSKRQPGSSFKAVVYTAAMEEGYTPDSLINDSQTSYDDGTGRPWTPKNSDGRFLGQIPLRTAIAQSRNVAAVKLLSRMGTDPVIKLAYRMGIRSQIPANLSIALGAIDASPLEMVQVFGILANSGIDRSPTAVKEVRNSEGKVLESNLEREPTRVVAEESALAMITMLRGVVEGGTGTGAQVPGFPVAGKTGTTDNFRDAWFCGFSPYYTMAVWVGNDNNQPMWRSYGGDLPATIFREVMSAALEGKEPRDFPAYKPSANKPKEVTEPEATPLATPAVQESPTPHETPVEAELVEPTELEAPLPEAIELEVIPAVPSEQEAPPVEVPAPKATAAPLPVAVPTPEATDWFDKSEFKEE